MSLKTSALAGRVAVCAALVGGLTLGVGTAAVAATVYTTWQPFTGGTISYQTRAYLTDAGFYGTQTSRADSTSSPAGYLQSASNLFLGTTVCGTAGPVVNSTAKVTQIVSSDSRLGYPGCLGAGNFTSKGLGYAYNPATGGYGTKSTLGTPLKYLPAV